MRALGKYAARSRVKLCFSPLALLLSIAEVIGGGARFVIVCLVMMLQTHTGREDLDTRSSQRHSTVTDPQHRFEGSYTNID